MQFLILTAVSFCIAEMLYTSIFNFKVCVHWLFELSILYILFVWSTYNRVEWTLIGVGGFYLNFWSVLLTVPLMSVLIKMVCSYVLPSVCSFICEILIPVSKRSIQHFKHYISNINEKTLLTKTIVTLFFLYLLLLLNLCAKN